MESSSLRATLLAKLTQLAPENFQAPALKAFVSQRSKLIEEIGRQTEPWTARERQLLESNRQVLAAMIRDMQAVQKEIAVKLRGTVKSSRASYERAYYGGRLDVKG